MSRYEPVGPQLECMALSDIGARLGLNLDGSGEREARWLHYDWP